MSRGKRAESGELNLKKVFLVIFIILLIVTIVIIIINKDKIFKKKDKNNTMIENAILEHEKTLDEIVSEFGGEITDRPKDDTCFVSKEDKTYTIYADGEIVEGQINPWNGESAELKPDEAGNYNVYTAEEFKWIADQVIKGEKSFRGITITLRNNLDLGARLNEDGTWAGPQWTSIIGFLDEIDSQKEEQNKEKTNTTSDNNTTNTTTNTTTEEATTTENLENTEPEERLKGFAGVFNGNNLTIRGLYIDSDKDYQGLFGYSRGNIQNLTIKNSYISGNTGIGSFVGLNAGTIFNCYMENTIVNSIDSKAGGIVGISMTESKIDNCYTKKGTVSGKDYVGGIVGYLNNNASIVSSNNYATVKGEDYVGGIAGIVFYGTTIQKTYNNAEISGNNYVGGISGYSAAQIENSYNMNEIKGEDYIGGLVGANYTMGNIVSSYNTGNISGNNNIGGIAGTNNASISSCYNSGIINTEGYRAGGICGQNATDSYIYTSYNIGKVNGKKNIGGITGGDFGIISSSYYLDSTVKVENDEQMKTEEEMKNSVLTELGTEFVEDTTELNKGYPVLAWQVPNTANKENDTTGENIENTEVNADENNV